MNHDPEREMQIRRLHKRIEEYALTPEEQFELHRNLKELETLIEIKFNACKHNQHYRFPLATKNDSDSEDNESYRKPYSLEKPKIEDFRSARPVLTEQKSRNGAQTAIGDYPSQKHQAEPSANRAAFKLRYPETSSEMTQSIEKQASKNMNTSFTPKAMRRLLTEYQSVDASKLSQNNFRQNTAQKQNGGNNLTASAAFLLFSFKGQDARKKANTFFKPDANNINKRKIRDILNSSSQLKESFTKLDLTPVGKRKDVSPLNIANKVTSSASFRPQLNTRTQTSRIPQEALPKYSTKPNPSKQSTGTQGQKGKHKMSKNLNYSIVYDENRLDSTLIRKPESKSFEKLNVAFCNNKSKQNVKKPNQASYQTGRNTNSSSSTINKYNLSTAFKQKKESMTETKPKAPKTNIRLTLHLEGPITGNKKDKTTNHSLAATLTDTFKKLYTNRS